MIGFHRQMLGQMGAKTCCPYKLLLTNNEYISEQVPNAGNFFCLPHATDRSIGAVSIDNYSVFHNINISTTCCKSETIPQPYYCNARNQFDHGRLLPGTIVFVFVVLFLYYRHK